MSGRRRSRARRSRSVIPPQTPNSVRLSRASARHSATHRAGLADRLGARAVPCPARRGRRGRPAQRPIASSPRPTGPPWVRPLRCSCDLCRGAVPAGATVVTGVPPDAIEARAEPGIGPKRSSRVSRTVDPSMHPRRARVRAPRSPELDRSAPDRRVSTHPHGRRRRPGIRGLPLGAWMVVPTLSQPCSGSCSASSCSAPWRGLLLAGLAMPAVGATGEAARAASTSSTTCRASSGPAAGPAVPHPRRRRHADREPYDENRIIVPLNKISQEHAERADRDRGLAASTTTAASTRAASAARADHQPAGRRRCRAPRP